MEAVSRPAKAAAQWMKEHAGEYKNLDEELEDFQPHLLIAGAMVTGPCMKYESLKKVPTIPTYVSRPHLEAPVFNALINQNPPRPSFYACSEVMDNKPVSFNKTMRTSAWVLQDAPTVEDLLPGGRLGELQKFLEDGPPPVAVGWGSMTAEGLPPAEMLELALRALRKTGKRAVILGGWAELDRMAQLVATGHMSSTRHDGKELAQYAAQQVCFVPSAPHDWLLPRCCCMVHHGGVGTTQAVLRAGRPSVVTPIFADQFDNAERIQELGAGVGFKEPLPKIKAADLEQAIVKATKSITTLTAETLGRKIRREEDQGLTRAVDMIDTFLRGKVKYSNNQWIRIKIITKKTVAE
jgi:UDP:flavonoid glycosyltransferase YjiC (YdhE family)